MCRNKISTLLCICLPVLLLVWMTYNYVIARLELIEARHLHAFVFLKAAHARHFILNGDTNSACVVINDGLRKLVQYAIRREVMDSHLNSRLRSIVIRREVELTDDERNYFDHYYDGTYSKWNSSNWLERDMPPLLSQLEDILYSRWDDRIELWTTWKPKNLATNIKLFSDAEIRRQRSANPEPVIPLHERLEKVFGQNVNVVVVTGMTANTRSLQEIFDDAVRQADTPSRAEKGIGDVSGQTDK